MSERPKTIAVKTYSQLELAEAMSVGLSEAVKQIRGAGEKVAGAWFVVVGDGVHAVAGSIASNDEALRAILRRAESSLEEYMRELGELPL